MGDTAISVENLGKKYIINHQRERYSALRDVIANKVKSIGGKKLETGEAEEFWALKDISFEVKKGDRIGVIGRNGAGKSTLLKVLSRITEPTTGRLGIKGRISSLLEVGTGFHPELTGRENIYLNGAILGMSRQEIKSKFDEIVEFAEVERFLDTPVKRYSSGMYVRLAFSVAAHMEPEILIVDEVLAVGDVQFQKKCMGKMGDVGREGRTVLFVSHNMGAIQQLCNKGLLLEKGQVKLASDSINTVVSEYLKHDSANKTIWVNGGEISPNKYFKPLRIFLLDENGEQIFDTVQNNEDYWLYAECEIKEYNDALNFGYAIYNEEGVLIYWSFSTDMCESKWPKYKKGKCVLRTKLPKNLLNEGTYKIELLSSIHYVEWLLEPEKTLAVIYLSISGGLSESPYWVHKRPGLLAPILQWELSDTIKG